MIIIVYRNGTKTGIIITHSESKNMQEIHQANLRQFLIGQ